MEENALAPATDPAFFVAAFGREAQAELGLGFGLTATFARAGVLTHDAGWGKQRELGRRSLTMQQRWELPDLNVTLRVCELKLCTWVRKF